MASEWYKDEAYRDPSELANQGKAKSGIMWYYMKGTQRIGPLSASEVKSLAESGQITSKDMVWNEGLNNWMQAGSIEGLFQTPKVPIPTLLPPESTKFGPVAPAKLKDLAANGSIQPSDLVWKEGMTNPQPAAKLKGLIEATSSQAPIASSERPNVASQTKEGAVAPIFASPASGDTSSVAPTESPKTDTGKVQTASIPARLWALYKQYLRFCLSVITATWYAAKCIVGDFKNRRETTRLKALLKKEQIAYGEKLFTAGVGETDLRQKIEEKQNVVEKQVFLTELATAALTTPQNDPLLQESQKAVQEAQETLNKHDQKFAALVASRPPVDKRRAWIGAGVLSFAFFAAALPKDEVITEEFLPHKIGAQAEYLIMMPGVGEMENQWSFGSDGRIESRIKKVGGLAFSGSGSNDTRVVRDGYVGIISGGENGGGFILCLKIGAKKGDTWEKEGCKYQVEEFGTFVSKYDKKTRVTVSVRQEMPPLPNGKNIVMTLVFAKGLGLIRKTGQSPAGEIKWELAEPEKNKNPTKAEVEFYEGISTISDSSKPSQDSEKSSTTYSVSKGFLSGKITVELKPQVAAEISLKNLAIDDNELRFTVKWHTAKKDPSDGWHYTAYDVKGTRLDSGFIDIPGIVNVGESFKSYAFIKSDNMKSTTKVIIHH